MRPRLASWVCQGFCFALYFRLFAGRCLRTGSHLTSLTSATARMLSNLLLPVHQHVVAAAVDMTSIVDGDRPQVTLTRPGLLRVLTEGRLACACVCLCVSYFKTCHCHVFVLCCSAWRGLAYNACLLQVLDYEVLVLVVLCCYHL